MANIPVPDIEEWLPVPSYPSYEASSFGRIRSIDRTLTDKIGRQSFRRGIILRPRRMGRYNGAYFGDRTPGVKMYFHAVICMTFHGERPSQEHQVAHWNGNRLDNKASNLRWATRLENEADKLRHGTLRQGVRCYNSKLSEADIRAIRDLRSTTRLTFQAIGDRFGISLYHARKIVVGTRWKHVQ